MLGRPVTTILVMIGMFTVSWDSLANIVVGGFNLKISIVVFFAAWVLGIFDRSPVAKLPNWASILPLVLVVTFFVAGIAADDVSAAMQQWAVIIIGTVIPFWVTSQEIRRYANTKVVISAFINGAILACCFGFYQLFAFYAGLPQIVAYEGLGGGIGRIRAFNYESAYFGYFLILAIAAVVARERLDPLSRSRGPVVLFLVALIAANTRAAVFTVPLVLVFLLASSGGSSKARKTVFTTLAVVAVGGLFAAIMNPSIGDYLGVRIGSILDPTEASSNALRLEQYSATSSIAMNHPWLGIGGGNLINYAADYGWPVPVGWTANQVIANNVWIQALLDGGFPLLLVHIAMVLLVVRQFGKSAPAVRSLLSGWIVVILVGGALTSNFYDSKLWVVLAIALSCTELAAVHKHSVRRVPEPQRNGS